MQNSVLRNGYLIFKYAIKRKINRFGYFLTKATSRKSRKAVQKKGLGIFDQFLLLFSFLQIMAIGGFFIYTNMEQVFELDKIRKIIDNNKIPSHKDDFGIENYHNRLAEKFIRLKSYDNTTLYDKIWEEGREDFYSMIHSDVRQNDYYKVKIELAFQEYKNSLVCPIESIQSVNVPFSQNSHYFSLIYMSVGMIVLFSLLNYIGFSMGELGSIDKFYEWLAFNSVPIKYICFFRMFENAFGNVINWFFLLPTMLYVYYAIKGPWYAIVAFGLWLVWSVLMGAIQVFFELYFQHFAGLKKGKIFQAICSVLGTTVMLTLLLGNSNLEIKEKMVVFLEPIESIWGWVPFFYLPYLKDESAYVYLSVVFLLFLTITMVFFVYYFSSIFTKRGFVTIHAAYQKDNKSKEYLAIKSTAGFNPILKIENLMLYRNKQIILTVFLTPCLLFTFYYFHFQFQLKTILNPKNVSVIAFGVCCYVFLFTTFRMVQREKKNLWFILTLPIPSHSYFFKKIWIWAGFAYLFLICIYAFYLFAGGEVNVVFVCNFFMVLVGIGIFALISFCTGVLDIDPLSTKSIQKAGGAFYYLYVFLIGFFVYGLYVDDYFIKINFFIIVLTFAFAIVEKTKNTMKYYLDRNSKQNELTIFESITFIIFYISLLWIMQSIAFKIDKDNSYLLLIGFIASVILLIVLSFSSKSYPEIKQMGLELIQLNKTSFFSKRLFLYIMISLSVAYGYLYCVKNWNFFKINDITNDVFFTEFALAAIFLAPFVEEILFRRLLFKTMKNYLSVLSAILYSSYLFALAHPVGAFLPVFFVGCLSASLYHSTKSIYQSILLHLIYNVGSLYIAVLF